MVCLYNGVLFNNKNELQLWVTTWMYLRMFSGQNKSPKNMFVFTNMYIHSYTVTFPVI